MIKWQRGTSRYRYLLNAAPLLGVLILSACSSSSDDGNDTSNTQADAYPSVKFTDCPFDASLNPGDIRCGILDTYENYELTGPNARIIELAFGIVPATNTPAAPDPIVIFTGGPGGSSLADFAAGEEYESYSGNRELILVDQRGTGFSDPFLDCTEFNDDELSYSEAGTACVARFEQQGVDLTQYRSAVIAQDFKVLREALEIPQWNVYGASYGPIPGVIYADLDSDGVRSVIFDSSTDNQVDIALADAAAPLDFITELAIQCAAETRCASRLPDLRSVFIDTFRSLMNDPWIGDIPDGGDFDFAGYILFNLIADLNPTEYPGILEIFANRDTQLLGQILTGGDGDGDGDDDEQRPAVSSDVESRFFANLMGSVVQCAAIDVDNYFGAIIPTKEQWPDDLLDVSRELVGQAYPSFCASGFVAIEQDLSQREPRSLNVPALILGGVLDPLVSLHQVDKLTQSIASPNVAIFPRGGHVVGYPNPDLDSCAKGIVTAFIESPADAPDMACLTEEPEPFLFGEEFIGLF